MSYILTCHPRVADDLEVIARLLDDAGGADRAAEMLQSFRETFIALSEDPKRAQPRPKQGSELYACPAGRHGIVSLQINKAKRRLRILAVSYGGEEWR